MCPKAVCNHGAGGNYSAHVLAFMCDAQHDNMTATGEMKCGDHVDDVTAAVLYRCANDTALLLKVLRQHFVTDKESVGAL